MQPQAKTKTSAQAPAQNDSAPSIQELLYRDEFNDRHIGPNDSQIASMLADLNLESLQDLIRKVVPPNILATSVNSLANSLTEREAIEKLKKIAANNRMSRSLLG